MLVGLSLWWFRGNLSRLGVENLHLISLGLWEVRAARNQLKPQMRNIENNQIFLSTLLIATSEFEQNSKNLNSKTVKTFRLKYSPIFNLSSNLPSHHPTNLNPSSNFNFVYSNEIFFSSQRKQKKFPLIEKINYVHKRWTGSTKQMGG
jgi:hypothetical protein